MHIHTALSASSRRTEPLQAELRAQSCRESHITTATGGHIESPSASVGSDPIYSTAEKTTQSSVQQVQICMTNEP
ncbi:hypothetical protein PAMA_016207 [Pampus argenteus]